MDLPRALYTEVNMADGMIMVRVLKAERFAGIDYVAGTIKEMPAAHFARLQPLGVVEPLEQQMRTNVVGSAMPKGHVLVKKPVGVGK